METSNKEKYSIKVSQFIAKWSRPFIYLLSYGLLAGLASGGLAIMAFSVILALLFDPDLFSGFALLTGGIVFAAGGSLLLWKMSRELESFFQSLEDQA